MPAAARMSPLRCRAAARGAAVRAADSWGTAIEVPGLGALNVGGYADVWSVSCASAGNCAAGGYYRDGDGHNQGFVVSEENGVWGRARNVPGLGALASRESGVIAVSCAPPGNCAAGGHADDQSLDYRGFVVSERNGRWGKAIKVPGLGTDVVLSVSCASAAAARPAGTTRTATVMSRGSSPSDGARTSRTRRDAKGHRCR